MTPGEENTSQRLDQIIDMLTSLARGDLGVRLTPSQAGDQMDIVISGLNMLAEELEAALQKERTLRESLEAQVEARTTELQKKTQTILQLSTPVLAIADGVLVLPIIGAIDTARAQQIVEQLLDSIVATQATAAILDVTGVSVIDENIADYLLKTARAAKMIGTRVILTGVAPETAKVLSNLGMSTEDVIFKSTLQAGLQMALGPS